MMEFGTDGSPDPNLQSRELLTSRCQGWRLDPQVVSSPCIKRRAVLEEHPVHR